MIEPIQTQHDDIIGLRLNGTVSETDTKPFLPMIKEKLVYHDKLRLYVEYVDMDGFSMDTFLENIKFNLDLHYFEKAVVITMKDWLKQAAQFANETREITIKSFHFSEKELAISWIEQ